MLLYILFTYILCILKMLKWRMCSLMTNKVSTLPIRFESLGHNITSFFYALDESEQHSSYKVIASKLLILEIRFALQPTNLMFTKQLFLRMWECIKNKNDKTVFYKLHRTRTQRKKSHEKYARLYSVFHYQWTLLY